MTPYELNQARKRTGWSMTAAAKICGVAFKTFKNWETGKQPMPAAFSVYFRVQVRKAEKAQDTAEASKPHQWTAEEIIALREHTDQRQSDLAANLGVHRQAVWNWENSIGRPQDHHNRILDQIKEASEI